MCVSVYSKMKMMVNLCDLFHNPQQSILLYEWQTKLISCPQETTATMAVAVAGFIH